MNARHVAIIGFGAIAQDLIRVLSQQLQGTTGQISVLVRPGREATTRAVLNSGACRVVSELDALLAMCPDVVVECAGHDAVADNGARILSQGIDMIVASVGALAETELAQQLEHAARRGGAQIFVPSGAIGAIDAVVAARLSGIDSLTYISRKPPRAWKGTPAEAVADLERLTAPFVFFEGSAREAALTFPKNANVAATLALAGPGMDATRVQLIADPGVQDDIHEFDMRSDASDLSIRMVGKPSLLNPKTSRSTVYSLARAVLNRDAAIVL